MKRKEYYLLLKCVPYISIIEHAFLFEHDLTFFFNPIVLDFFFEFFNLIFIRLYLKEVNEISMQMEEKQLNSKNMIKYI